VHFEVIERKEIKYDPTVDDDGYLPGDPKSATGIYLTDQKVVQHNEKQGHGFKANKPDGITWQELEDAAPTYTNADLDWVYEEAR